MRLLEARFDRPYPDPSQADIQGNFSTEIRFFVGPNKRDQRYRSVSIGVLKLARDHIGMIVDRFEKM